MYDEKDFDFAIEVTAILKTYVANIGKSLQKVDKKIKTSKELLDDIDLIGCALTEAKERLFGKECAICDGIIEVEDAKNSERGYNKLCLQHQKECFGK